MLRYLIAARSITQAKRNGREVSVRRFFVRLFRTVFGWAYNR